GDEVGDFGNGETEVNLPIFSVSVVETIKTPISGIDEVYEAKNEEENRVEGLGTNASSEVAAGVGFEPLNQTSKLDYASELNDFAVDFDGVEKGVMPLRSEIQITNKPDKFCGAHNLFDKLPKPNLSEIREENVEELGDCKVDDLFKPVSQSRSDPTDVCVKSEDVKNAKDVGWKELSGSPVVAANQIADKGQHAHQLKVDP
ncbi:hypothetical protein U1Q18_009980, partial [Sarracenia purpurea var. burkii]